LLADVEVTASQRRRTTLGYKTEEASLPMISCLWLEKGLLLSAMKPMYEIPLPYPSSDSFFRFHS
jgi:hypothetical protein